MEWPESQCDKCPRCLPCWVCSCFSYFYLVLSPSTTSLRTIQESSMFTMACALLAQRCYFRIWPARLARVACDQVFAGVLDSTATSCTSYTLRSLLNTNSLFLVEFYCAQLLRSCADAASGELYCHTHLHVMGLLLLLLEQACFEDSSNRIVTRPTPFDNGSKHPFSMIVHMISC